MYFCIWSGSRAWHEFIIYEAPIGVLTCAKTKKLMFRKAEAGSVTTEIQREEKCSEGWRIVAGDQEDFD